MTIWSLVQRSPPRPERRGAAVAGRAVSCVPALSCSPTRSDTCCTASPRISRRTCSNCPAREQLCPTRCGRFVVADAVGGLDARRRMTCCGWIETPSRGSVWLMVATRRTDLKFGLLTPVSYYGIIAQSKHGQSTGPALPAHPSYSGWAPARRGAQAHAGPQGERAAPAAAAPRRCAPGPRHAEVRGSRPLPPRCPRVPTRSRRARRVFSCGLSDHSVHRAKRSRASHRRGRDAAGAIERTPWPRHPDRPRRQPRARPQGTGVGRPVSRAAARHAAGRAARARLRSDEFSEASQGRDRDRSVLVCRMVRRVARATRRERHRAAARGFGTDLARARRLATARADSIGGAAEVVR